MSAFLTIKKLCSKLKATLADTQEEASLAGVKTLIHEVQLEFLLALLDSLCFNLIWTVTSLFLLQLFVTVSGKIVDCIINVKIAQVLGNCIAF